VLSILLRCTRRGGVHYEGCASCRRFDPGGSLDRRVKIVAACPSPDGLARDGTQGGENAARVILRQGDALAVGVRSVREGEREQACSSARPPAR
jgi:hypothetical protein